LETLYTITQPGGCKRIEIVLSHGHLIRWGGERLPTGEEIELSGQVWDGNGHARYLWPAGGNLLVLGTGGTVGTGGADSMKPKAPCDEKKES
jgi:hypothetical protein